MSPPLADSLRWSAWGTDTFADLLRELGEADYSAACLLPGWSRRHLVAHVANNAIALGNLVRWAATGVVTPMYASMEQREADIERDAALRGEELSRRFAATAETLAAAMDELSDAQWETEVLTVRGERMAASMVPWLRAREVMIHAVDLDSGPGFGDLPVDFLSALCTDISARRTSLGLDPGVTLRASDAPGEWSIGGGGDPVIVTGSLGAVAAYLAGRGSAGLSCDGAAVPVLGAWI